MRLVEKVGKLTNGKALTSAGRHLFVRPRGIDLDPATLIGTIDSEAFEDIRRRNPRDLSSSGWPKYLDLPKWMDKNLRRIRSLGLDAGSRKSILDLGCGAGYFLFIAKYLGHDVLGLDIDEVPMFGEMIGLFGLKRVIWRVQPFVQLPQLRQQFDLITAFMICFNGHKTPASGEWRNGNSPSRISASISRRVATFGSVSIAKMMGAITARNWNASLWSAVRRSRDKG